jgi:hypothetical protein
VFTDPSIGGETEDLLPPDFVQIEPSITTEDIELIVNDYFTDNPIDVETEVAAALAADPPLLVGNDGSDVNDPAAFLTAIGGADAADTSAALNTTRTAPSSSRPPRSPPKTTSLHWRTVTCS